MEFVRFLKALSGGNSCSFFLSPIPEKMLEQSQELMWGRERGKGNNGGFLWQAKLGHWELGVIYCQTEMPISWNGRILTSWRNLSSKGFESWQLLVIPAKGTSPFLV